MFQTRVKRGKAFSTEQKITEFEKKKYEEVSV